MISVAKDQRGRALEWLGTAIVLLAALRYWLWYFDRNANLLDEGSTAAQALRVFNGELIYRDFFTVVTPASYYTVAWLFQLFGPSLMVLRWAALVTGLGILLVTLLIARRVMSWPFAAAAALMTTVWGWFLITPNFYSLEAALFALLALWCYLRHLEQPHVKWIVLAGLFTGLAALTKQNVGVYAAAAIVTTIWISRAFGDPPAKAGGQLTVAYIAGICIPVLPTLLFLIAAGAGPYLYESWMYYPLAKYPERFAVPYPSFFVPLTTDHGVYERWVRYVIYLPVVVYPIAAILIARDREHRRALTAIALMGVLLLLQSWPRADVPHILFGLQPTFIMLAYVLYKASGDPPAKAGGYIRAAVMLLPMLLLLWNGYRRTDWEYSNYVASLKIDRAQGVETLPIDAQRINLVTQYIRANTAADDSIFVVPLAAGFYFLTDRANATRTDFLLFADPETYPCLLARLEERRPKYVIYGYTWDVDNRRFRDYAAPIDAYIRSRYAVEDEVDGYEIWRRLDSANSSSNLWSGACRPRRFRWNDFFGSRADSSSTAARSVQ